MNRKRIFFGLLVALGLAAGAFAARWAVYGRFHQATDNAYVRADTVDISAKAPGRVAAVLVAENAAVAKGDPLVAIESDDYDARLAQARADLAARRADIASLDQQVALARAQLVEAEAAIRSAAAAAAVSSRDLERYEALAKEQYASRQQLDRVAASRKSDAASLDRAEAARVAAAAAVDAALAQRAQGEARVKWGESAVRIAEIDAGNTVIRAPTNGVVGDVSARPGEYAAVGRRLMTVVPLGDVYVVANYKETQIRRFRGGEPAVIEIDAFPGREARGVIDSVSPASGAEFSLLPPENATGNFTKIVQRVPVRIRITEKPQGVVMLPGMSVRATIDTRGAGERTASLFAPRGEERRAEEVDAAPTGAR